MSLAWLLPLLVLLLALAVFSVRRANDPARSLTVCARVPRRSGCAVLAELARRYPGDLDAATTSLIASWEHARRA